MDSIQFKTSSGYKTYSGASSWDELGSKKLFLRLFKLSRIAVDAPFARFMAGKILFKVPGRYLKALFGDPRRLEDEQTLTSNSDLSILLGLQFMAHISWVWEKMPKRTWYFPSMRIFGRKYESISDGLSEMTFGQFMFVERYFEQCTDENAKYAENLRLFLACLYRPQGSGFNHKDIERIAWWMRFVPSTRKEAILFNYTGLREHLCVRFPEIFPKPDPNDKTVKKKGSSDWIDVALSLAGKDIEMFHAYENDDVWLVLKIIKNVILDAKAHQEALENAKKKRR